MDQTLPLGRIRTYLNQRSRLSRLFGDGKNPTLMTGILIMGPYKPLRTWVDDHPLLYGNNGSLDLGSFESEVI